MLSSTLSNRSDSIGAFASGLCLIHCIATPFIFIAQACTATCCADAPTWWVAIDYLFLGIAFFAIWWSARTTTKNWIKYALWVTWVVLFLVIVNERINFIHLPHAAIYLPALGLITLHLYNRKYCQCQDDGCCANT